MEIFRLFGSIFLKDQDALRSLNNIDKKGASVGNTLGSMGTQAMRFGKQFLAATGLILSVRGLVGVVTKTIEAGGAIQDLSDKTGISVQRIQELKYVADQTGASMETVTGSIGKLIRRMGDADNGSKESKKAFDALGLSIYNANGGLKSVNDFLPEVLSALSQVSNETERNSLALDIFGRSAMELAPLMQEGANSIEELTNKFRKLGLAIDDDTIRAADKLSDDMATLNQAFNVFTNQIVAELMPALTDLVNYLIENKDAFASFLGGAIDIAKYVVWEIENITDEVYRLIDAEGAANAAAYRSYKVAQKEMLSFEQMRIKHKKDTLKEVIKAEEDALSSRLRIIDEEYQAQIDAAGDTEKVSREKLDDRMDAERDAHDARMGYLDDEYDKAMDYIDDTTDKRIDAIQDEIDAIEGKDELEDIEDLRNKVATTQNMGNKKKYMKELADLEKKAKVKELRNQIDTIREEASNQKDALRDDYEAKKKNENNKYKAALDALEKERKALDGYTERYKKTLEAEVAAKKKAESDKVAATVKALKEELEEAQKASDERVALLEKENNISIGKKVFKGINERITEIELYFKENPFDLLHPLKSANMQTELNSLIKQRRILLEQMATGGSYASGTDYVPHAGSYMVGERGPEEVMLPQGASVTPNHELGQSSQLIISKGAFEGVIILDDYGVDRLFDRMSELWKRRGIRPQWQ